MMRAVMGIGLLALFLVAGTSGGQTQRPRIDDILGPDTPDTWPSRKPRSDLFGTNDPDDEKFEVKGWTGHAYSHKANFSNCSAESHLSDNNIGMTIGSDLDVSVNFTNASWHLPSAEEMDIAMAFVDGKGNTLATQTTKAHLSSGSPTTIFLHLSPYDRFTDFLLASDTVAFSANGVESQTFGLARSNFAEVYQYLRQCEMRADMRGFDNDAGAPASINPGAISVGTCSGNIKFGWCLSRAPTWHGAVGYYKSANVPLHGSNYVMVPPTISGSVLPPDQLYARVKLSSYVVHAQNAGAKTGSQGSGVAVGPHTLLTNCHVVMQQSKNLDKDGNKIKENDWDDPYDRKYGVITIAGPDGDGLWKADVVEEHCGADIAILQTGADLYPINGIRQLDWLKIGEPVYAVGAPRGMTGTLTPGSVANILLRNRYAPIMPDVDVVVSSAAITPGNSGGGLFDQYGNLIALNDSVQPDFNGLYFAVAIYQIFER
jgi:S1-C subfamily serine protease